MPFVFATIEEAGRLRTVLSHNGTRYAKERRQEDVRPL